MPLPGWLTSLIEDAEGRGGEIHDEDLAGTDLAGLRLHRVARWAGASLRDADLRGAVIDGLARRAVDLTGARVEVEQAVARAQQLGVRIG